MCGTRKKKKKFQLQYSFTLMIMTNSDENNSSKIFQSTVHTSHDQLSSYHLLILSDREKKKC